MVGEEGTGVQESVEQKALILVWGLTMLPGDDDYRLQVFNKILEHISIKTKGINNDSCGAKYYDKPSFAFSLSCVSFILDHVHIKVDSIPYWSQKLQQFNLLAPKNILNTYENILKLKGIFSYNA